MWSARVLAISIWLLPALASAQRIIHLDETACGFGFEPPQPVWVVAASPCPAATLAARCGGTPVEGCPDLAATLTTLPQPLACTPEPDLLGAAEALRREGLHAEAIATYRALSSVPELAAISAYRIAEIHVRRSEYADAAHGLAALLSAPLPARAAPAAIDLYAFVLSYDDVDEDRVPDPDALSRPFLPEWLPSFDGDSEVAVRVLQRLSDASAYGSVRTLLPAFRSRWPAGHEGELASFELRAAEAAFDHDAFGRLALAAAAGCEERGEDCAPILDQVERAALSALASCGAAARSRAEVDHHVDRCLVGAELAQAVLGRRPDAMLAADVVDALAWARAEVARGRGRREEPSVPAPPPLRASMPELRATPSLPLRSNELDALFDPSLLARCAPPRGAVLSLSISVDAEREWTVRATPIGPTARCIEAALAGHVGSAARSAIEEPGAVQGHVWFPAL